MGHRDITAKMEFPDIQESRGSKEMPATMDFRAKTAIRELPVKFQGLKVLKEKTVSQEMSALLDLLVTRVKKNQNNEITIDKIQRLCNLTIRSTWSPR